MCLAGDAASRDAPSAQPLYNARRACYELAGTPSLPALTALLLHAALVSDALAIGTQAVTTRARRRRA